MLGGGGPSPTTFSGNRTSFNALKLTASFCFTLFATGTLIFTVITVIYHLNGPLPSPTAKIPLEPNPTTKTRPDAADCRADDPIDCHDPDVFHLLMAAAFDRFKDVDFLRFGNPAGGNSRNSCHMAWKFRPKGGDTSTLYKDYRSFSFERSENCTVTVVEIGDYRSGSNAITKKGERKGKNHDKENNNNPILQIDDDENALLSTVEPFTWWGKYLMYSGGGDKCKNMNQYLWSFTCMLWEARFLNRTLVVDTSICLSKIYTSSGRDEDGRDFRSYFDYEHLRDSWPVVDRAWFLSSSNASSFLVDDLRVSSKSLLTMNHMLIVRRFGLENYGYEVCEGGNESRVDRPWKFIWKSRPLMDIAGAIAARMMWDYDAVRVLRGTASTGAVMETLLGSKVGDGRNLYISTDEENASFFEPLKEKYSIHFLGENEDLWGPNSDWEMEMRKLNGGNNPMEFDGFMRESVDDEVFSRAKRRFETFGDRTKD